jgi:hypothetical protein
MSSSSAMALRTGGFGESTWPRSTIKSRDRERYRPLRDRDRETGLNDCTRSLVPRVIGELLLVICDYPKAKTASGLNSRTSPRLVHPKGRLNRWR